MNIEKYIGIPFEDKGRGPAFDCWGFVIHVLDKEFGITGLPDFGEKYSCVTDKKNIPLLVAKERQHWQEVSIPKKGDVVVFNISGIPCHVGICINGKSFMHIHKDINACLEHFKSSIWKNRIAGFYRYE